MTREKAIEILKQRECCRECVADCSCDECENAFDMAIQALEQEPTTKNDLGVDCIDRNKAYEIIENWAEAFDVGTYFDNEQVKEIIMACANRIDELPSVTPQKPRKGEWLRMSDLSEQEDDRYKCSRCGNVIHHKNKMDLYTFNSWCGRCGSDNGRHVNYEVEE